MNKLKKIGITLIIVIMLITNVPNFTANIIKERELQKNYEQLENTKQDLEQEYDEIVKNGKEEQYYREEYNLSSKDDVLFEFPKG